MITRLAPLLAAAALATLLPHSTALSQTPAPAGQQPGNVQSAFPLFRAQLPGGIYEVAVGRIIAVTSHEYIVDGAARVVEVNIDTAGSILARFYYIEPNTPAPASTLAAGAVEKAQQLLTQATDKTGIDAWKRVVKTYPTTTHARTVEYRLQSREELNKIFDAADEAFRLQKQKTVRIN
jgi:hypothetical protein